MWGQIQKSYLGGKYGFQRAKLTFTDSKAYTQAQSAANRLKDTHVSFKCCYEGEFEGFIYLMYEADKTDLEGRMLEDQKKHDDWWRRYHDADEATRRKMASGELP